MKARNKMDIDETTTLEDVTCNMLNGLAEGSYHYVSEKRKNQYKETFLRVFLEEFVINNRAFDVASDGSLTLHVFEEDAQ